MIQIKKYLLFLFEICVNNEEKEIMKKRIATIFRNEIKTKTLIYAERAKVWNILTDYNRYPSWNPFIKSLEGNLTVGEKIRVQIQPPDSGKMVFNPKVLRFIAHQEFAWLGHFIIPGLFDGEHIFILSDNGDGSTTFLHRENFKGLLVPFFRKMLDNNTRRGFHVMNLKLKQLAEQQ